MSKHVFYRQCRLERRLDSGVTSETVTWLPEQFACVGSVVQLRNDDRQWENGWTVLTASDNRLSEKSLPDYRKRIRSHRNATGDSAKP